MKIQNRKDRGNALPFGFGKWGKQGGRGRFLAPVWLLLALVLFLNVPAFAENGGEGAGGGAPMGKLLVLIICLLLLKAARVAAAVVTAAVCPNAVERARERISAEPVKFFALGVADMVAAFVIIAVLAKLTEQIPPLGLVTLAFLILIMALTVLGSTGVYGCLGRRIGGAGAEKGDSREILRGGATLETATLIPFLGWAADAVVLCMAFGIGVLLLFEKRGDVAVAPTPRDSSEGEEE